MAEAAVRQKRRYDRLAEADYVTLIVKLPRTVRTRFKRLAHTNDMTMQDFVIQALTQTANAMDAKTA